MSDQPLLRIKGLEVQAPGEVCLLDGVELSLQAGEILALVGESGCGKTLTALATLGLLPSGLRCTGGRILFQGRDLLAQGEAGFASVRGCGIGVVFQQPGASLHPGLRVGDQLARIIRHHRGGSRQEAREAALRWLARLGLPDPAETARSWPHQLSGGMAQRVGLALALTCGPRLLLADEPSSSLDPTVQARILTLLHQQATQLGLALLLITHDLALAATWADRIAVMDAGRVVESGSLRRVLEQPTQPLTRALLAAGSWQR